MRDSLARAKRSPEDRAGNPGALARFAGIAADIIAATNSTGGHQWPAQFWVSTEDRHQKYVTVFMDAVRRCVTGGAAPAQLKPQ